MHLPEARVRTQRVLVKDRSCSQNYKVYSLSLSSNKRFSGNIILELDNKPAMRFLLSLLPPQTEEEKLNPTPLFAKLRTMRQDLGSLYVTILGGSKSRGGVALDPLVSTGRLANGMEIEFGQLRQSYLATPLRQTGGVHIQLEVLSHMSRRWKRSWKRDGLSGTEKMVTVGFQRKQRFRNYPVLTVKKRLDYQGIQLGLFAAGSEGGFLIGESGVVPWLCRTRASRVRMQITPIKEGQTRLPVPPQLNRYFDTAGYLAYKKSRIEIRKKLKEKGLIVSKKVVFVDDSRWITVPYLRKKKEPKLTPAMRKGLAKTKQHNQKAHARKVMRERFVRLVLILQRYRRHLQIYKARANLKKLPQYEGKTFYHPGKLPLFNPKTLELTATSAKLSRSSHQPPTSASRARRISPASQSSRLPTYLEALQGQDPEVYQLIQNGEIRRLRFFGHDRFMARGPRRYSFRARGRWSDFRPKGFKRSGHRPGGFRLDSIGREDREKRD
jgi:hypothetical protein